MAVAAGVVVAVVAAGVAVAGGKECSCGPLCRRAAAALLCFKKLRGK